MELLITLSAVLMAGIVILGLLWRRATLLIGDRRVIDRLAAELATELRIRAHTHATLRAMHEAARRASHNTNRQ